MTKTETKKGINRREFIKGATAGAGVAALSKLTAKEAKAEPPPKEWQKETDVVIVGAGGGGLCAAIEACDGGADVVLLEKGPIVGGSTAICGGLTAFAGTDEQKAMGINDSNELFYKDFIECGEGLCMEEVVKVLIEHQLETYRWLKKHGAEFQKKVVMASGMSVPRCHQWERPPVIEALEDISQKKGTKILTETSGRRLVTDCDERVLGVEAESKGRKVYIKARKAVVLCTGGFGRNPEMIVNYVPSLKGAAGTGSSGCVGDGHRMAQKLGANLVHMGTLRGVFVGAGKDWMLTSIIYYLGGIIVNKNGKRFVKESLSYKITPDYVVNQPDQMGYTIFDHAIAQQSRGMAAIYSVEEVRDYVAVADTIEGLAAKLGITPKALRETIENYNRYVEVGQDPECGRTTLAEQKGKLVKLETPPWYGLPQKTRMGSTYGGIQVDRTLHVVDVFGKPITRLYAAGEIIGGVHGAKSHSGTATLKAFVFGRLAGKNASAEAPWG